MQILVCNAGSTSLKMKLLQMPQEQVLVECRMDRIGDPTGGSFSYTEGDRKESPRGAGGSQGAADGLYQAFLPRALRPSCPQDKADVTREKDI